MQSRILRMHRYTLLLCCAVLCALALLCVAPASAQAKSYTCPKVEINAQAQTNATLHVIEQRTFVFTGDFTSMAWQLDEPADHAKVTINGVRMAEVTADGTVEGEWVTLPEVGFQLPWRDEPLPGGEQPGPGSDAWSFDTPKNTLYTFFDVTDKRIIFELDYRIDNGVLVFDDTSEIIWSYISSGWPVDSQNVTMEIALPVPQDTRVVPGENVRAWGHGPGSGIVDIGEDGVVLYRVPRVPAGQFCEAHVLFPEDWMTNISHETRTMHQGSLRLDGAIAEEKDWIDSTSATRSLEFSLMRTLVVISIAAILLGLALYLIFGREHRPAFRDSYSVEIPPDIPDPAVIGRIWRWNRPDWRDFVASILDLELLGKVGLGQGRYTDANGNPVEEYFVELIRRDKKKKGAARGPKLSPVQMATLRTLFQICAKENDRLWFSTLRSFRENRTDEYKETMREWNAALSDEVKAGRYFDRVSYRMSYFTGTLSALFAAGGVACGLYFSSPFPVVLFLITAGVLLVITNYMPRRTVGGNDLIAYFKALRNWLREGADKEFSRDEMSAASRGLLENELYCLEDENSPEADRLWERYFMYGFLFGVSDRTMELRRETINRSDVHKKFVRRSQETGDEIFGNLRALYTPRDTNVMTKGDAEAAAAAEAAAKTPSRYIPWLCWYEGTVQLHPAIDELAAAMGVDPNAKPHTRAGS